MYKQANMKALRYFVFIAFQLAFLSGFSQGTPLRFGHLETGAGLSNNKVSYVFKDKKGFMWFATQSGLNRYDGTDFKIFRYNENDSTSAGDNSFKGVFELPEARLGMLTTNGELNIYDPATEKLDRNYKKYFRRWYLPEREVADIKKDAHSNYWFLYTQGDLYKYNVRNGTALQVPVNPPATGDSIAPTINAFSQDTKGNTWLIYRNGYLEKLDDQGHVVFHSSFLQVANKDKTSIYSIYADAQDELWISALGLGVFYYNPHTDSFLHLHADAARSRLNTNNITISLQGIVQANDGRIWIATDQGGINVVDKKDFSVQYLTHEQENSNSISQNAVVCLYTDNTGIIWAGTFKQGLNFYNKSLDKFPLLKHYITDPNSLPYDDVNRFAEDAKGNLWIGTNGGGLIYFDRKKNKFSRFTHNPADPNSLCGDIIVSLFVDHEQKLWVGTYMNGLDSYDGKKFTHYRHNPKVPESISENNIWEIFEDSKQNLWVGTIINGLDLFDREKKVFYHYRNGEPNLQASDFSNLYVSALAEDRAGNILVGTATGLEILNTQTKRFTYYTLPLSPINNNIIDIKEDSRGLIWLATNNGVNLFDPKNKTFKLFRKKDGLPDAMVLTILEDNMHNLWMSTPKGLCNMIIKQDEKDKSLSFHFKNYDNTDGLQGSEFNENAAFKTKDGELVFGGPYGINIFKPDNILVDHKPPGIILTDFRIFDKSVMAGEMINGRIILPLAFSETKTISLKYHENFFSIKFASFDFSQTKKTSFEYILDGLNKDWLVQSSTQDNKATYTNLDPGVYTFKIKAVNSDGISSRTLSVQIIIIPPFWMTWWFRLSILIAIAGGAFFFIRFHIRNINNQKIKLQEQVNKQTSQLLQSTEEEHKARQQAEEANKNLERKNKELEQFAYVASHDMQEPLRTTSSFVELLQQQYHGKLDKRADKYLTFIAQSSDRMKVLIKDLLDYSRIGRKKELNAVDCNLLVKEVLADLGVAIKESNAEIKTGNLPVIEGYPTELKQLFQNLLINAVKFKRPGIKPEIEINANKINGYWEFTCKDNGIGIDPKHQERIFIIFQRLHTRSEYDGSGIGLAHCKKIVELHGGKIWINSVLNEGATFHFTFPNGQAFQNNSGTATGIFINDNEPDN